MTPSPTLATGLTVQQAVLLCMRVTILDWTNLASPKMNSILCQKLALLYPTIFQRIELRVHLSKNPKKY